MRCMLLNASVTDSTDWSDRALARQQPSLIVNQIGSLSAGPRTQRPSVRNSTIPPTSMSTTASASTVVSKGSMCLPWTYSIFGSYSSRSTGTFSSADEGLSALSSPDEVKDDLES